ncbi:MAG: hypothetical protein U0324_45250 [Polyangiales bacterium]
MPDAPDPICRGAEVACADRCVDTSSHDAHCGRCYNACPLDASCRAGRCELPCPAGQVTCLFRDRLTCVDLTMDPSHCGACGAACAAGRSCIAGRCGCPAGQQACAERCVDTATSLEHCGACGAPCSPPRGLGRCAAGVCTLASCDEGRGNCNGTDGDGCEVNLRTNPAHCGACGRSCAAGEWCVAGVCCVGAACAPFPSSGREGAFAPAADTVLSAGVHEFTTVTIPAGVTVRTDGVGTLEIRATGAITILGTVDLSGADGGRPRCTDRGCSGGAGGATGHPGAEMRDGVGGGYSDSGGPAPPSLFSGTGGAGSAGGGGGHAQRPCGFVGALLPGQDSAGGAAGGRCTGPLPPPIVCTPARSGPCAVATYAGRDAETATLSMCSPYLEGWTQGGGGGGSIGTLAAMDLPVATTFQVGSGGGGGGWPILMPDGSAGDGGGGGGGGGGALRIASPVSITLGPAAQLLVNGGHASYLGGGGGSGGVVVLAAPAIVVPAGARVSARGGNARPPGGDGGLGRIRVSVTPSTCTLDGSFDPPLHSGCTPVSSPVAGRAYVGAYPD